jgi:hypothetical protein
MVFVSPDVVERVRMEYLEMPGLALTSRQARRLFNLDAGVCEDVLAQLVREQFLSRSISGVFSARDGADAFSNQPSRRRCASWPQGLSDGGTDMSDLQPAADDIVISQGKHGYLVSKFENVSLQMLYTTNRSRSPAPSARRQIGWFSWQEGTREFYTPHRESTPARSVNR